MSGSSTYLRARVVSAPRPRSRWRPWELTLVRRLHLAERELERLRRDGHRPRGVDAPFLKVPPLRPRA